MNSKFSFPITSGRECAVKAELVLYVYYIYIYSHGECTIIQCTTWYRRRSQNSTIRKEKIGEGWGGGGGGGLGICYRNGANWTGLDLWMCVFLWMNVFILSLRMSICKNLKTCSGKIIYSRTYNTLGYFEYTTCYFAGRWHYNKNSILTYFVKRSGSCASPDPEAK